MTGKPAAVVGLANRGQLKPGMAADIVVFNPETIIDKGTFIEPNQYPEGIDAVMVNGAFALVNGVETYARSGQVIRKAY